MCECMCVRERMCACVSMCVCLCESCFSRSISVCKFQLNRIIQTSGNLYPRFSFGLLGLTTKQGKLNQPPSPPLSLFNLFPFLLPSPLKTPTSKLSQMDAYARTRTRRLEHITPLAPTLTLLFPHSPLPVPLAHSSMCSHSCSSSHTAFSSRGPPAGFRIWTSGSARQPTIITSWAAPARRHQSTCETG
jgi:hypothetical protein